VNELSLKLAFLTIFIDFSVLSRGFLWIGQDFYSSPTARARPVSTFSTLNGQIYFIWFRMVRIVILLINDCITTECLKKRVRFESKTTLCNVYYTTAQAFLRHPVVFP
jgi:hypothetical protein